MLVLFETAAGFAIFKLLDEKKLKKVDTLFQDFENPTKANKVIQLRKFKKFVDSAEALQAGVALSEGKVCKPLKSLLKSVIAVEAQEELLVWDAKLGGAIKEKLGIQVMTNNAVGELMRCIKSQVDSLIPGLNDKELNAMSLGLAHNLARYKIKFSPDKVDTMVIQAVSLLDDIDKELNNYIMRAREWYGWHFPELSKIITDNLSYAKSVLAMETRDKACDTDFSEFLPENVEEKVKEAAEISMGTEITEEDVLNICTLCTQVIELTDYRAHLAEYLTNRMHAIAPNTTILVGEMVGARLIAHAGSLMNLAKHPASTIQILGAEKALFRALKDRKSTPKYGLIFHAHLVGQTSAKNKGKMSRMLAAKAALAIRYDALGEETTTDMGTNNRAKLASRLRIIEEGKKMRISGLGYKSSYQSKPYVSQGNVDEYEVGADNSIMSSGKRKLEESSDALPSKKVKVEMSDAGITTSIEMESKKKKKKKKKSLGNEVDITVKQEVTVKEELDTTPSPKKKKKKKSLSTT